MALRDKYPSFKLRNGLHKGSARLAQLMEKI